MIINRNLKKLKKVRKPYCLKYCCLCADVKNDDHALATLLLNSVTASIAFPYSFTFSLAAFIAFIAS